MENSEVEAVHDDDLISLLKSLGVYDKVVNGEYKCIYCGNKITLNNIDAIVPFDKSVAFTCNSDECHLKLITNKSDAT